MRIYLLIMRTSRTLDPLFSRSVQEILTAVLLEREDAWYLSDLAQRLGRSPSTLQRPLNALVRAGIITRRTDGNRVYFARDTDCPFLPELQGLLEKTTGLAEVLQTTLQRFGRRILVAFVHGSVAKGTERSQSDVDLLIVGELTLADLSPALLKAEKKLRRPVNATVLLPPEFRERIAKQNHFLHSVLATEKIFLVGTTNDLEELAGRRKGRSSRHKQIRT